MNAQVNLYISEYLYELICVNKSVNRFEDKTSTSGTGKQGTCTVCTVYSMYSMYETE